MLNYQKGDFGCFRALYGRYAPRIYGYIRSRVSDQVRADDLHQTVFLKLHEARHKYDPAFPFAPWLFTICRNVMTDNLRKDSRDLEKVRAFTQSAIVEPLAVETSAIGLSFENLPEAQRLAMELRFVEGLSFEEMSRRLNTSVVNSRKLVSRAIAALRKRFPSGSAQ